MYPRPAKPEAYDLMHNGAIALAQVERNGMRVDTKYLTGAISSLHEEIMEEKKALANHDCYKLWRKHYGEKFKFDAPEQLANILFKVMKLPGAEYTEKSILKSLEEGTEVRLRATEGALSNSGHPFAKDYIKTKKKIKARRTLIGIQREVVHDRIHCFFNLHTTKTYRSSSSDFNFQNLEVRNKKMSELIRSTFISTSKDYHIIENDFSGIEVGIAACYHKDKTMLKYIKDPSKDMHRDMAIQCYRMEDLKIPKDWWSVKGSRGGHDFRYTAKNQYVFPQFYGDYYVNNARAMWESMEKLDMRLWDGTPLREHLRQQGIKERGECNPDIYDPTPGSFEEHMLNVQNHFWQVRFPRYGKWKRAWFNDYEECGRFETLTGFMIEGIYNRNEVINYPVQGSAFHCLLWSLIKIQNEMNRKKMKSKIVGQIHDSIVGDVHRKEKNQYLDICQRVMTEDLLKEWDWIIVPLKIEAEVAPAGASWYLKEKVKL